MLIADSPGPQGGGPERLGLGAMTITLLLIIKIVMLSNILINIIKMLSNLYCINTDNNAE